MNNAATLLEKHFDTAFNSPNGIKELRSLILKLAMMGKLVPQDANDQPASELLKEIQAEKEKLISNKELKAGKITNDSKNILKLKLFPKTWTIVKSNDIFFITKLAGFEYTKYIKLKDEGDIPVIRAQNVRPFIINETKIKYIDLETSRILDRCALTKESLLVTFIGAGIGDVAKFTKKNRWHLAPNVAKIEPYCNCENKLDLDFILYYLNSMFGRDEIFKHLKSTAQPSISMGTIRDIDIPLPPLNEQKRIVAKINELMSRCDTLEQLKKEQQEKQLKINTAALHQLMESSAKNSFSSSFDFITNNFSSLYGVKENVEELKKSILQLAMMGRLVSQDANDQPASELLEEIQAEKEKLIAEGTIRKQKPLPEIKAAEVPYELSEGWVWCRLNEAVDVRDGTHDTPKYCNEGIPLITSKNLYSGVLNFDNIKYISLKDHEVIKQRSKVEKGDLLFAMIGSIGNPVVVDTDIEFSIKNVALFKYYKNSLIFKYYLYFFLLFTQEEIRKKSSGAVQKFASLTFLRNYMFPLPPINEQQRIVAKINELMALCDNMLSMIDKSEQKQDKLLHSVLSKV